MEGDNGVGMRTTRCEMGLYGNTLSNFSGCWPLGADDLKRPLWNTNTSSCVAALDDEAATCTLTQALLSSTTPKLIRPEEDEDYRSSSPLISSPFFPLQRPFPNYYSHLLWAWGAEGESIKQEYQGGGGGGGGSNNNCSTGWRRGRSGEDSSSAQGHGHHHYVGGVSAVKMKKQRRKVREPRFSFKTMTDVDVLDDGYKWRKYGQKVVKNTLHPRSYYRCTQEKCRVKKRVERLAEDPRMVITTYEGRHIHSPSNDLDDSQTAQLHLNNFFW